MVTDGSSSDDTAGNVEQAHALPPFGGNGAYSEEPFVRVLSVSDIIYMTWQPTIPNVPLYQ